MRNINWDNLNPGDFIKAAEFDGKSVTMRIASIDRGDFIKDDGTPEKRGVVSFTETDRKWVLNVTNIQLLRAMWPTIEDAVGQKVTLVAEDVQFGKDMVEGIRVKGAPHLTAPVQVEVKLPRKKPIKRTLVPTAAVPADEPMFEEES